MQQGRARALCCLAVLRMEDFTSEQLVVVANQREVDFDALLHRGIGNRSADPVAVRFRRSFSQSRAGYTDYWSAGYA